MQKVERQLATIMFSDIAGYSRLMDQDESSAIQWRRQTEAILKELVPRYDGQIIQFYGDGAMMLFDSNVEALECAFEIQKAVRQVPHIRLRIGLHTGDVAIETGHVFGECVNIASRIETFCLPGAVMFSGRVYEDIRNQKSLKAKSLGDYILKNIQAPIRLYALVGDHLIVPEVNQLSGKGKRREKRVAVLPFVNMSSDPDNEYFSDGMTEEILNMLSKQESLRVTARTSSFAFKGHHKDMREIGRALDVDAILEGSVRKVGNRVRITAQLIDTSSGYHLLSESYDRTLDDIFAVQDEIAHHIAMKMRKTLGLTTTMAHVHKDPTDNLSAYEDYLKAIYYWNKFDFHEVYKAIEFLERAIRKDPKFAQAYAFYSFCYSFLGGTGILNGDAAFPRARESAEKALMFNDRLEVAHCALGLVYLFFEWDMIQAEACFLRAKAINKSSVNYLFTYALFLRAAGRFVEAVETLEEAIAIDPVSQMANAYLANAYMNNHEPEKALMQIDQTIKLYPDFYQAYLIKAEILLRQEKWHEALDVVQIKIPKEHPAFPEFVAFRGYLWARLSETKRAETCQKRLTDLASKHPERVYGGEQFLLAFGLGNIEKIKTLMTRALEHRKGGMIFALEDPFWVEKIASVPELQDVWEKFKALVKR